MADWQAEMDIKDAWKTDDSTLISKRVVDELIRVRPNLCESEQEELDDLVQAFREIQDEFGHPAFRSLMSELYDWADNASVWIATVV